MKTLTMKGFPTGGGGTAEPNHYSGAVFDKPICTKFTKHTKNLKAFLKTNVFWGLTHNNDKTKIKHPANLTVPNDTVTSVLKRVIMKNSIENGGCMKKGFTLAEVLITLGIIGIVAAMTMPTLIQKQQKKEASARLKKFVSTFSQALLFAENEHGPKSDWQVGEFDSTQASMDFLNVYIKPYVKYIDIVASKTPDRNQDAATMRFLDGSTVTVKIGNCYDIIYDYNGEQKPNQVGKDIFKFILCRTVNACYGIKPMLRSFYCEPKQEYEEHYPKTREEMIELCKAYPGLCIILVEHDNWEIKDDYPW